MLRQRVDVLQDVDLAVLRPLTGPQHPERRPVADAAGWIGLLDWRGPLECPASRRPPVRGGRLDTAGCPRAALVQRGDVEITVAVEVHVAGRAGHGLDLTGAEIGAGSRVVHPAG